MKKILLSVQFFIFFLITCQVQAQDQAAVDDGLSTYLRRNLAFVDIRVRALNQDHYVKEVLVVDFAHTSDIPDSMAFLNVPVADDGKGFDLQAGDGIYTSIESYRMENSSGETTKSVYDKAIVDPDFAWRTQLNDYLSKYSRPGAEGRLFSITLDCKVTWCVCSNPNCHHCFYYGCIPCPNFSDCRVSITWGF